MCFKYSSVRYILFWVVPALSNLIISSNIHNIWDYNINALKTSINSFFRDEDIARIIIKEESGIILVDLLKKSPGTEKLTLKKNFSKKGRNIGILEITFTNYSVVKEQTRKKHNLLILLTITVLIAAAIIFFLFNVIYKSKTNFYNMENINWSISDATEDKLKNAISYINENYNRNISREGLASKLNLNPDNLGRYFKIYTGEKINDYVNRLRIEEAAKKMSDSDDNIVDIAFAVGFENISTFNRAFFKIKKETPTKFRRKKS